MNFFFSIATRPEYVEQLIVLCYSVGYHGNLVFSNLLSGNDSSVASRLRGNVISDPLPSNGLFRHNIIQSI
jgi:hypothetical protein